MVPLSKPEYVDFLSDSIDWVTIPVSYRNSMRFNLEITLVILATVLGFYLSGKLAGRKLKSRSYRATIGWNMGMGI